MSGASAKPGMQPNAPPLEAEIVDHFAEPDFAAVRARQAEVLRLLWDERRTIFRTAAVTLVASLLIAILIPNSYTSTAQLMPPDSQSATGMAMMAAIASKAGALSGMAGDLLGLKSSGALFVGVLRSETSQDRIIEQFDLKKVYHEKWVVEARKKLDARTAISEDHKSGIISISVTDHDAQRAAAMANAYVDELNSLVAQLSTSAAHREREFLEGRLKVAKVDLDEASNSLAQFSSRNNTLDIQTEGKAMLDAASTLAGQLVAAQAELEGLRQIYTDNNARVKALNGRVTELRKQLEKLGGVPGNANANGATLTAKSAGGPPVTGADAPSAQATDLASGRIGSLPFPTIRNLPLLGAKYADYYRQAKIQETVFELLTEQYELAKVEEAKETPSVKVLDPGRVPERKSFPPRTLIVALGTFLGLACSVVYVLGAKTWHQTPSDDPRKILAQEVAITVKASVARLPWVTRNGHGGSSANGSANADSSASSSDERSTNVDSASPDRSSDPHGESGAGSHRRRPPTNGSPGE